MPIETLTYAAFAARLNISPMAARSLARRRRLPRSLSDDGKALLSVDLAEIRHKPRRPANRGGDNVAASAAKLAALHVEIARLEAIAAGHRADFERERERTDRLMVELLQATAETIAARETTARLEGFLRTRTAGSSDSKGLAERPLGHLAAELVGADRKAVRQQSVSFHSELSADIARQR
jgi:hypothetical protein